MSTWLRLTLLCAVVLLVVGVVFEQLSGFTGGGSLAGVKVEPDLVVKRADGKPWTLRQEAGHPVLLSCFATWCGPCREEFPQLTKLRDRYAGQGVRLVMATLEDAGTIRSSIRDPDNPRVTILVDAQKLYEDLGVSPIPHTFVFDRKGKLMLSEEGFDPELSGIKRMDKALREALAAK